MVSFLYTPTLRTPILNPSMSGPLSLAESAVLPAAPNWFLRLIRASPISVPDWLYTDPRFPALAVFISLSVLGTVPLPGGSGLSS